MNALDLTSATLPCHVCGYDLRAHAADGICPECAASVAESRRLAAIPRRPAWRDSDSRWRRRMLAGAWVLVLVPLMQVLVTSGWASSIVVPTPHGFQGSFTLDESLVTMTYEYFTFCIGVVLLFSKERNRQPNRLDWTRRWGVITSYGVFLLGIPHFGLITALVTIGIAALFISMPLRYQPGVTGLFVNLGWAYIRYGPHPGQLSGASLHVFSSVVVLLACAPLYDALRSTGPIALVALLVPLFVACVVQLADVLVYGVAIAGLRIGAYYAFYFDPEILLKGYSYSKVRFIMEIAKWLACLSIAVWLSIAQIMSWRAPRSTSVQVRP